MSLPPTPRPDAFGYPKDHLEGICPNGTHSTDQLRAYGQQCYAAGADAEREPARLIFNALQLAMFVGDDTRTGAEMRTAAVTLFGEEAVFAAIRSAK